MFKKIYYLLLCMAGLAISLASNAQDSATTKKVEMADAFRTNGKIFVVIAVLITILLGLMLYMIRLDRKIGRLEKESKK
jgi:hypothetical protein